MASSGFIYPGGREVDHVAFYVLCLKTTSPQQRRQYYSILKPHAGPSVDTGGKNRRQSGGMKWF